MSEADTFAGVAFFYLILFSIFSVAPLYGLGVAILAVCIAIGILFLLKPGGDG